MGKPFWDGFLKQAASLVGSMPGITSGLRAYSRPGRLRTASPVSGQSIGSRSIPAPVPGPRPISGELAAKGLPVAEKAPMKLPPAKKQTAKGLGSVTL